MKLTQVISEKAQSENLNNSKKKAAKSHVPFKFNKYRPRVMVESDEEIPIFEIPDLKKVKPESQQEESVVGKEEQSLKSKQTFRASKFSIFGDEDDGFRGRKSKQHGKRKIRGQSEVVSRRDRKFRRYVYQNYYDYTCVWLERVLQYSNWDITGSTDLMKCEIC